MDNKQKRTSGKAPVKASKRETVILILVIALALLLIAFIVYSLFYSSNQLLKDLSIPFAIVMVTLGAFILTLVFKKDRDLDKIHNVYNNIKSSLINNEIKPAMDDGGLGNTPDDNETMFMNVGPQYIVSPERKDRSFGGYSGGYECIIPSGKLNSLIDNLYDAQVKVEAPQNEFRSILDEINSDGNADILQPDVRGVLSRLINTQKDMETRQQEVRGILNQIRKAPVSPDKEISNSAAYTMALGSLGGIQSCHQTSLEQAKSSFRLAVWMCILGSVLIAIAILLPLLTNSSVESSVITAIGGVFVEVVAGTAMIVYKNSQSRLDQILDSLAMLQRLVVVKEWAKNIKSKTQRDKIYAEIIKIALNDEADHRYGSQEKGDDTEEDNSGSTGSDTKTG